MATETRKYNQHKYILAELEPGDLFRIDDAWYRLDKHAVRYTYARRVGNDADKEKPTQFDPSDNVSELSVLSRR